jgi:hypothetical protein
MNGLIQHTICSDSRFRRETLESQGGASHLNLFDTSPLQVHTQQTLSLLRLLAQILEIAVYRLLSKPGVCVVDRRLRRDTGVSDG